MTTTTTRFGLTKIQPLSDNVDVVADFNNNWDAIDLELGSQVATSSTRPSSPVQGQQTFETDTGYTRVYTGSAWRTVGLANATTGALPANPIQSDLVYLNDVGAVAYYSGGAWHTCTLIVCTSASRPAGSSLQTGSFIYETDTLRLLVWNGSAWVSKTFGNFVCTSSTHPSWAFQGLEIYETDTGQNAVYNGTNYLYGLQQLAPAQSVSAAASVTFSGLPAVNRLMLAWRLRSSTAGTSLGIQIDGDTTSGHYIWAKNSAHNAAVSAASSSGDTHIEIGTIAGNSTANYFSCGTVFINGWNATNGFCNTDSISNAWDNTTSYWVENQGGMYVSTAVAHTSVKLIPGSGTFTGEVVVYGGP